MEVKIPNNVLLELSEKTDEFFKKFHKTYGRETDIINIDLTVFSNEQIGKLKDFLKEKKTDKTCINALNMIKRFENIASDVDAAKIKDLKQFESAMKMMVDKSSRKWIYRKNDDGMFVPYFVEKIEYKRTRSYEGESAAYISIELECICATDDKLKRQSEKIYLYSSFFRGDDDSDGERNLTLHEIGKKKNFYFETPDFYNEYVNSKKLYEELIHKTGKQFLAKGKGRVNSSDSWYYRKEYVNLINSNVSSRLVIDEECGDRELTDNHIECSFWKKSDELYEVPIHAYLQMYDLTDHQDLLVHVDLIEEYEYDKSVINKIVLKEEQKYLLDILCADEENLVEDIIQGKTGGIIVMCSGEAGVGKTLTAEVYSEYIQKPLYKVQSSQLGISVDQLETNLKDVLDKASRWKAILLIDESDTYIHERGNDIVQNCIVGVFLRLLEYYKGVMFMTTNKATIIDDAIISRCIAHLRYELPDDSELIKIFEILSEQFKMEIKKEVMKGIAESNKKNNIRMSGRDVKNTLKLLKKISDKTKKEVTVEMFEGVSKFMNYTNK